MNRLVLGLASVVVLMLPLSVSAQPADSEELQDQPPPDDDQFLMPTDPEPEQPATSAPVPPPPPVTPPPPTTTTTTAHPTAVPVDASQPATHSTSSDDEEDDEDEDHREWFWLEASAGYSWINLVQINSEDFSEEPDLLQGSGFIFEGGLGVEFSILQIGVTSSYATYQHFNIVTAELDVTLVIPIPIIEPFLRVGVGYAHMGQVEVAMMGMQPEKARIRGIGADVGAGLDIHISDAFQLGFAFDASILNLQRQKVTELGTIAMVDFTRQGNAVGLQLNATARITFQF
jgi:hypothetical protein